MSDETRPWMFRLNEPDGFPAADVRLVENIPFSRRACLSGHALRLIELKRKENDAFATAKKWSKRSPDRARYPTRHFPLRRCPVEVLALPARWSDGVALLPGTRT